MADKFTTFIELPLELFCDSPEFKLMYKDSFALYCVLRANCKEQNIKTPGTSVNTKLICILDINSIAESTGFTTLTITRLLQDLRKRRWIEFEEGKDKSVLISLGIVDDKGDNWFLEKKLDDIRVPKSLDEYTPLQVSQSNYLQAKLRRDKNEISKIIHNNIIGKIVDTPVVKKSKKAQLRTILIAYINLYKAKYNKAPDSIPDSSKKYSKIGIYIKRIINYTTDSDLVLDVVKFLFAGNNWERIGIVCPWLDESDLNIGLVFSIKMWPYYVKYYKDGIPTVENEKQKKVNIMQRYQPS